MNRLARRLGLPVVPAQRLRRLLLALALLNLAAMVPPALGSGDLDAGQRALVLGSIGFLAWRWLAGDRRGRFSLAGDLPEAAALVAVCALPETDRVMGLLYAGLCLRSLYGSDWRASLTALTFVGAYVAAVAAHGPAVGQGLPGHIPGLVMAAVLIHLLRTSLERREEELAEHRRAEDAAERRVERQAALVELGRCALERTEPAELESRAVRAATDALGADFGEILQLDPDGRASVRAAVGWPEGFSQPGALPAGPGSQAAFTVAASGPVVVADARDEPRFAVPAALLERGILSSATVAIRGPEGIHGVLGVHSTRPAAFSADDAPFLDALANVVAGAIGHRREAEAMRHRALHDPLTGLPNRELLVDRLRQALARSLRHGSPVTVLFVDLDDFDRINDSGGHHHGDRVLCEVARRLHGALRTGDTVSRLGGDEFAILCEDRSDAAGLAARISDVFAQPFTVDGKEHRLSASVGVARSGADHEEPEDLLRQADAAMYDAKRSGEPYAVRDGGLSDPAARADARRPVPRAARRGEVAIAYRPIVALEGGGILGLEALAYPGRSVQGPLDLAAGVDEPGALVPELEREALRRACRDASGWRARVAGDEPETLVMVALSGPQLRDPDLVYTVTGALEQSGLRPPRLCLELSAEALDDASEGALESLTVLNRLGVRLGLEGFGGAASSAMLLKRLRLVDFLKLEPSFVRALPGHDEERAIVAAILGLAGALGMTAVAQGVACAEQAAALRELGCPLGQGDHLGAPRAPEAVEQLLAASPGGGEA